MPPTLRKRKAAEQAASDPQRGKKGSQKSGPGPGIPSKQELLPTALDRLARESPNEPCLSIAKTSGAPNGFEDITFATLAHAVNRTARWLVNLLKGHPERPPESPIAYMGPSDARYLVLTLAAIKVGAVMFFPSPQNSIAAQVELLQATGCGMFLSAPRHDRSRELLADKTLFGNIPSAKVPTLKETLSSPHEEPFPFEKTFEGEKKKPFFILHTSGTTGTPKPVVLPHDYYSLESVNQDAMFRDAITSRPFVPGARCLATAPLWHAGGLFFGMLKPLLSKVVAVLPPANEPITPELVDWCLRKHGNINVLQAVPYLLDHMSAIPRYQPHLKAVKHIVMGSGPMPSNAGDRLLQINPNTLHFFGATETDLLPLLPLEDPVKDWQYHQFHPLSGATFSKINDDLYELVITRVEGAPQPCFTVDPDAKEYHTKNAFSPHPTKPDLWRFECRLEDIITFSTGEKMNPTTLERALATIPGLVSPLVVGDGRPQPALIYAFPKAPARMPGGLPGDAIWAQIEEANKVAPTYGRISRQLTLFAGSFTAFHRTPKGTVNRRKTEAAFKDKLDRLYATSAVVTGVPIAEAVESHEDIADFVNAIHKHVTGVELGKDSDVFTRGTMDSLKVAQLVQSVNKGLAASRDIAARRVRITPAHIYSHRSAQAMGKALHEEIQVRKQEDHPHWEHEKADKERFNKRRHHHHKILLEKHFHRLPAPPGHRHKTTDHATVNPMESVVLTGSTGALGSHLLHALLHKEAVKHIHCLDRSMVARDQYLAHVPEDEATLSKKAHFHQTTNFNAPHLGLGEKTFKQLASSTTTLIHNAWPVHFHLPLQDAGEASESMETLDAHVGGIASLLSFAAHAKLHPQLVFISSLASVIRYHDSKTGMIPEEIVTDSSAPEESGYAGSKWMSEQLIHTAISSHNSIRKAVIIRPGQIAGSLEGGRLWDPNQVIPSLILSSKVIGALPNTLGEKDKARWIPVDVCADMILELTTAVEETEGLEVYNVTNIASGEKEERTWSRDLLPVIKQRLERERETIKVVGLKEWIEEVEAYGAKEDNPAYRLLDFYQNLGRSNYAGLGGNIQCGNARAGSKSLRELGNVQDEWLEKWMEGWGL